MLLVREPRRGGLQTAAALAQVQQQPTESLWTQVRRLFAITAFRRLALACGMAGIAGYGYGVWTPSFLVRTHGLGIAQAGLLFGVASGVGAVVGALCSGWLCDRLVARDVRWQLGLPLVGVVAAIPCAVAFFLAHHGRLAAGHLGGAARAGVCHGVWLFCQLVAFAVVQRHQPHGGIERAQRGGGFAEFFHHAVWRGRRPW